MGKISVYKLLTTHLPQRRGRGRQTKKKKKKIELAQSKSKRTALALGCDGSILPTFPTIFTPTFWPSAATAEGQAVGM